MRLSHNSVCCHWTRLGLRQSVLPLDLPVLQQPMLPLDMYEYSSLCCPWACLSYSSICCMPLDASVLYKAVSETTNR